MASNDCFEQREKNRAAAMQLYAAFARRDLDALEKQLARDVIWTEPANPFNPSAGTHYGHSGFREWVGIGNEAEDILVFEPLHFLADGSLVVVLGFERCRVIGTGSLYESDFVHVLTFVDEKVAKFQEFFDTYAAAEAFRGSTPGPAPGT